MNEKVPVNIFFFASARDFAGVSKRELFLNSETSFTHILEEVFAYYPDLSKLKDNLILSLNQEYCDIDQPITLVSGDEIAIIPPISGG